MLSTAPVSKLDSAAQKPKMHQRRRRLSPVSGRLYSKQQKYEAIAAGARMV